MTAPSLAELTRESFKIGCLGFGGPAGQIALMHRIFVEEKKWIDEPRYLHALNYCMLLPGPEAHQLATYVGWLLHGVRGGLIAGVLFVLPGAAIVFALSWLYALYGQLPVMAAVFLGVKAAVLALVVDALVRIGGRALKTGNDLAVAAGAFVMLFVFGVPFPLVILAGALCGLAMRAPAALTQAPPSPSSHKTFLVALIWGAAWLAPLALVTALYGDAHVLTRVGMLFSQLAIVTFGGAYAVLAYLQQQAVDVHHWLTAGQMIDDLGLAETTPGPLILVNQFVGFLAGWQAQGGGFGLALAAAALASWCTFAPSFLWIFAGAPYAERLRASRVAAALLRGVSAAVLGVISSLGVWFAQHVLFAETAPHSTPWGRSLAVPIIDTFLWQPALIAFLAGIALVRLKAHVVLVVTLCALAGAGTALA